MAIKVSGTTVINDSRELNNITSVDATTVAALGAAGVGAGGGSLEATASGTLPNGDVVIVKSDGTVSVVTGIAQNIGTQFTSINENADYYHAGYDSTANRIILAWASQPNSYTGYVIAGSISNETITFGSAVNFTGNGIRDIRVVHDTSANKTILFHKLTNDSVRYTVISLSGSTITVDYQGIFTNDSTDWIEAIYDSSRNRAVLFYEYNNYGASVLVTTGSSSLSFSNRSDYDTGTYHGTVNAVFDTTNNKIFVLYGRSNALYVRMGTPNAGLTSISWGSAQNVGSGNDAGMAYDPDNDILVIAYKDSSFSPNRGTIKTVSINANGVDLDVSSPTYWLEGSPVPVYLTLSVSYDTQANKTLIGWTDNATDEPYITPVVVDSGGTITVENDVKLSTDNGYQIRNVFCAGTANRSTVFYKDIANGRINKGHVVRLGSTDLTESNFIGFSDGSYTNGQTATVLINGSVTDDQTGLTPATKYYVDGSGSLTATATNNVYAGIAVSSTKLIIKA